jgi:NADH:ubiquinone oxidoreductase subunit
MACVLHNCCVHIFEFIGTQEFNSGTVIVLAMAGRHRWVEYADAVDYDASSVPPEWHGWLHHITDHTPEQVPNRNRIS